MASMIQLTSSGSLRLVVKRSNQVPAAKPLKPYKTTAKIAQSDVYKPIINTYSHRSLRNISTKSSNASAYPGSETEGDEGA